jgi:methylphosphotriester-DNA--protein-cysteine methyltransferase
MGRIALLLMVLLLCATTAWGEVWGSTKSKAYHRKLCRWMGQVKPEYRIGFATPLAARKAGYHPCATCRPPGVEPGETGRKPGKS